MPTMVELNEAFEVLDKHLIRRVVPRWGTAYEHRYTMASS